MSESYTENMAARPERLYKRRGKALMPQSLLVDLCLQALAVPVALMGLGASLVLLCLLIPGYLRAKWRRHHRGSTVGASSNVSVGDGGSITARWTALLRAVAASSGFGPDVGACLLVQKLSLLPRVRGGWLLMQLIWRWVALQFKLTRTFIGFDHMVRPLGQMVPESMIGYMQARTCWLDDVVEQFAESRRQRESQLVILGAGFDTRCWRLPLPASMSRFEVDAPGTQQSKLDVMRELGVDDKAVVYVLCDFSCQDWVKELSKVGFKRNVPTCVIWEGVTYYLTKEAVKETLLAIRQLAPGSMIAFDYVDERALGHVKAVMEWLGEPVHFLPNSDEVTEMLKEQGLNLLDHLDSDALHQRYLPLRSSGDVMCPIGQVGSFVLAGR